MGHSRGLVQQMMELITLETPNPVFYAALGPVLGNYLAEREVGAPIRHHEGKTWVVALVRGVPRAWAAVFLNQHDNVLPAEFSSTYVDPHYRRQGYYKALIEKRLELAGPDRYVIVRANTTAALQLKKCGFRRAGVEEGLHLMVRPKAGKEDLQGATLMSMFALAEKRREAIRFPEDDLP